MIQHEQPYSGALLYGSSDDTAPTNDAVEPLLYGSPYDTLEPLLYGFPDDTAPTNDAVEPFLYGSPDDTAPTNANSAPGDDVTSADDVVKNKMFCSLMSASCMRRKGQPLNDVMFGGGSLGEEGGKSFDRMREQQDRGLDVDLK
jgi:hypothetical protein